MKTSLSNWDTLMRNTMLYICKTNVNAFIAILIQLDSIKVEAFGNHKHLPSLICLILTQKKG